MAHQPPLQRESLEDLLLDEKNPRLPPDAAPEDGWTQDRLLEYMARKYNLLELGRSMADKGFSPEAAEALLVARSEDVPEKFIVVEGNRRIATLKLLTDLGEGVRARLSSEWIELAEAAKKHDLDPVAVIAYDSRRELEDYLGYRHIKGPVQWRPESKARFITHLLENPGSTFRSVARAIGSNRSTVARYAEAYAVFSQAEHAGVAVERAEAGFGTFYNALKHNGIRGFLNLKQITVQDAVPPDPVPNDEDLATLLSLLFGDDDNEKVIVESREIGKLSDVLQDERARAHLLENRNLDAAWRIAGGVTREALVAIDEALLNLATVNGWAFMLRSDSDVVDGVRRLEELLSEIGKTLRT